MKALLAIDEAGRRHGHRPRLYRHPYQWLRGAGRRPRRDRWDDIERASGLARADLEAVAARLCEIQCDHHHLRHGHHPARKGTGAVQQLANLLLLRGNIGKPGAGICPLRGHSNVQGDRTVGITEKPSAALLAGIDATFGFTPPRQHGHDAVAALQAIIDGRSKVLICLGGNLAVAMPDPERASPAMRRLDLNVHIAHQAQPLASAASARKPSFCRAWAAPRKTSRPPGRSGHGGRFDVDGARLARQTGPGLRRICAPSRRSWRTSRRPRCRTARSTGGFDRRLRPHPRQDRGRVSRSSRITTSASASRRFPSAAAADRAGLEHAVGQGRIPAFMRG